MILDTLENALKNTEHYSKLNSRFAKALEFLATASSLEDGRYELDGDKLYAMIVSAPMRPAADALLEAHERYIDIQMPLTGGESYAWAPLSECVTIKTPYCPNDDIVFFENAPTQMLSANAGELLFFFPHDGHAPIIGEGTVRKVIVKVSVEE